MKIVLTIDDDDGNETGTINIAVPTNLPLRGLIESMKDPEMKKKLEEAFLEPLRKWHDKAL